MLAYSTIKFIFFQKLKVIMLLMIVAIFCLIKVLVEWRNYFLKDD